MAPIRKTFHERFNEIIQERRGVPTLIDKINLSKASLYRLANEKYPLFSAVKKIADGLDLIPIAFYKEEDNTIEDLGVPGFNHGEEIDNYTGKVFKKYRAQNKYKLKDMAEQFDVSVSSYSRWESARWVGKISQIESIGSFFGLYPAYLLDTPAPIELKNHPEEVNEVDLLVEKYIVKPFQDFENGLHEAVNTFHERIENLTFYFKGNVSEFFNEFKKLKP
jgi:transcriptional regulator with XRE-family HTH domain